MIIYPAIDLKDGKCVRLRQGDFDKVTVYSENPGDMAKEFVKKGAKFIHMVDLDGAKDGKTTNAEAIKSICEAAGDVPVQLGGGIRTMENVEYVLSLGVSRVILGTAAVKNPDFAKEAAAKFGDKVVVGIDAKDGMVAVEGWIEVSNVSAIDLALKMKSYGIKTVIYTDIETDGMLKGPNLEAMKEMLEKTGMDVIASGGVSEEKDLENLEKCGVSGAIVGKAIYDGRVDLEKVLKRW